MWRDRPMLGIDTETTSPIPEEARLVTACAGLATSNGWAPREWLYTQPEPIPAGSTAVHGVTTEWANEHGTDPAQNLTDLVTDLYRAWDSGMTVVIYNAPFDTTVIDRNLRIHGLPPLEIRGPIVDPLLLERATDPDKYLKKGPRHARLAEIYKALGIDANPDEAGAPGWYTLRITHYRHFGRDMDGTSHGAGADARAACRLAWSLASRLLVRADWSKTGDGERRYQPFGAWPLPELHDLQVQLYEEDRLSFAAYRARKGEPLDDVNTHWPLRPAA